MLPVSLIFTSGVASGVNSYAAVLVLGLLGRFGHIAAIPPVLERPSVLAAAAVLYIGQFVVGKIPMLDSVWDVVHTALRPVVGSLLEDLGVAGLVLFAVFHPAAAATVAALALAVGIALFALLASRIRRSWHRRRSARLRRRSSDGRMAGSGPSPQLQDVTLPTGPSPASRAATSRLCTLLRPAPPVGAKLSCQRNC